MNNEKLTMRALHVLLSNCDGYDEVRFNLLFELENAVVTPDTYRPDYPPGDYRVVDGELYRVVLGRPPKCETCDGTCEISISE